MYVYGVVKWTIYDRGVDGKVFLFSATVEEDRTQTEDICRFELKPYRMASYHGVMAAAVEIDRCWWEEERRGMERVE